MLLKSAPQVWHNLKGIVCINKPADMSVRRVRQTILTKICADLNEMDVRPPMDYVHVGSAETNYEVVVQPNLADHPLVVGPRYIQEDIPCSWSNYLGSVSSGVLSIQNGTKIAKSIRENHPTRAYKVKGQFGQVTQNYYKTGAVLERTTWRHVKRGYMDSLLANMQAAHQRKMFEVCGVDMRSQAAYELAVQGLIRPKDNKVPILYGIKCVEFNPPEFTIEVQCVNEYETYLMALIHEIGMKLHSSAHCTGIKCIRHSHFTLDHSLLRKHWDLQSIITNMEQCSQIMDQHDGILQQTSAALQS